MDQVGRHSSIRQAKNRDAWMPGEQTTLPPAVKEASKLPMKEL